MTKAKPKKKTGRTPGCEKTPGSGRKAGTPNKTTALLKDAILQAAKAAGDDGSKDCDGLVEYLKARAVDTPGPFLALLGKVLPIQVGTDPDAQPVGSFIFVPVGPEHEPNQD